jgi:hypothetical protein
MTVVWDVEYVRTKECIEYADVTPGTSTSLWLCEADAHDELMYCTHRRMYSVHFDDSGTYTN